MCENETEPCKECTDENTEHLCCSNTNEECTCHSSMLQSIKDSISNIRKSIDKTLFEEEEK
jgi:hypothetical protein